MNIDVAHNAANTPCLGAGLGPRCIHCVRMADYRPCLQAIAGLSFEFHERPRCGSALVLECCLISTTVLIESTLLSIRRRVLAFSSSPTSYRLCPVSNASLMSSTAERREFTRSRWAATRLLTQPSSRGAAQRQIQNNPMQMTANTVVGQPCSARNCLTASSVSSM